MDYHMVLLMQGCHRSLTVLMLSNLFLSLPRHLIIEGNDRSSNP